MSSAGGRGVSGDVRLFFAGLPDRHVEAQLSTAAGHLALCDGARPVPLQNYHLTLVFVGAVPPGDVEKVQRVGSAQRGSFCGIVFDAFEYWPKPEVVVAAARIIPPPLESLWCGLHRDLSRLDLALQPKRLRPHVTLAHGVSQEPAFPAFPGGCCWNLERFSLMRSERRGAERVYTVVDTWPLLDEIPP